MNFVSYNILTGGGKPYISYCEDELLERVHPTNVRWINRKYKIREVLNHTDMGVLVESVKGNLNDILPKGSKYVHKNKYDKYGRQERDGTTIYYDPLKYIHLGKFDANLATDDYPTARQIVLVCKFQEKKSGKVFCVVGLHLKSGYGDMENIRKNQIIKALKSIEDFTMDLPVIMAGDFNSDKLAKYRSISLEELTKNGYDEILLENNEITYHFWHKSIFDYVFIKSNCSTKVIYHSISTGVSYCESKISPNENQGSDHFPINCVIELV